MSVLAKIKYNNIVHSLNKIQKRNVQFATLINIF